MSLTRSFSDDDDVSLPTGVGDGDHNSIGENIDENSIGENIDENSIGENIDENSGGGTASDIVSQRRFICKADASGKLSILSQPAFLLLQPNDILVLSFDLRISGRINLEHDLDDDISSSSETSVMGAWIGDSGYSDHAQDEDNGYVPSVNNQSVSTEESEIDVEQHMLQPESEWSMELPRLLHIHNPPTNANDMASCKDNQFPLLNSI